MDEIESCCRCGRPANPSYRGAAPCAVFCHWCRPGVLESQRDQLLDAIHEHAKDVERQVSKGHWSRANAALYRARLEVLRQLGID
jgi:hypothetical protein